MITATDSKDRFWVWQGWIDTETRAREFIKKHKKLFQDLADEESKK